MCSHLHKNQNIITEERGTLAQVERVLPMVQDKKGVLCRLPRPRYKIGRSNIGRITFNFL